MLYYIDGQTPFSSHSGKLIHIGGGGVCPENGAKTAIDLHIWVSMHNSEVPPSEHRRRTVRDVKADIRLSTQLDLDVLP